MKTDEGFYQCLAESEVGNIQASAQLIILDQGAYYYTSSVPTKLVTSYRFPKVTKEFIFILIQIRRSKIPHVKIHIAYIVSYIVNM